MSHKWIIFHHEHLWIDHDHGFLHCWVDFVTCYHVRSDTVKLLMECETTNVVVIVIVYIVHMRCLYYCYSFILVLSYRRIWLMDCSSIQFWWIWLCRITSLFNESISPRCTLWQISLSVILFVCDSIITSFKKKFSSEVWNRFLWVIDLLRKTLLRISSLLLSFDLSVVIRTKVVNKTILCFYIEMREMIELWIKISMMFKWSRYMRRHIMQANLVLSMQFCPSIQQLLSVKRCLLYGFIYLIVLVRKDWMIIDLWTLLIWRLTSTMKTDAAPLWLFAYYAIYRFDFLRIINSTSKHVEHI